MRTKKHLTQFLKMGSVSFWVQFHAYRINISFADYCNKKTFDDKPFNTANTKINSSCNMGFGV